MPKIQQILRISKHNNLNVNALALVFAVFFAQSILAQIPKNGLVAYYPFTGNANDSSGNGYHGTTSNVTLVKDRFGRSNCAYSFSGNTNSNIEIPSSGLKNNNYSYSVWIKINSLGANGTNSAVFEVAQGGNATGQVISVANNYLGTSKGITGGGYNKTTTPSGWVVSTKTIPSTSPWFHVVFARGNDFQYLYIDGVLKDSFKSSTPLQPEYGNPVKAFFGIRCNSIQPFNGIIDDAAFYNRVITPCEVTELYTGINPNNKPNGFTKAILHRACLDKVSGQLDLKITPSNDTFSKFVFYRVWGKDNASGTFQLLHKGLTRNKQLFTLFPPSKKKWELYISTHWNTCSGTDSLISNTLFVDDVAPLYVEPDSVSVDIQTQQVYAGWTSPPVADILGYSLFKVDAQGNNQLIDEKNVLNYTFNGNTFNPLSSGNRLAIAAYDSCRNGGIISKYHSPMVLFYKLDNNYLCNNTIRFQWTNYVGWTTESHLLIIEDADANKVIGSINLSGLESSLDWTLPYLGLNIRVYVRAFKSGNASISSTSNVINTFISKAADLTTATQLDWISVDSEPKIELSGRKNMGDSGLLLYRDVGATNWILAKTITKNTVNFNYTHSASNSSNKLTEFVLKRFNPCGIVVDSSVIQRNILLQKSGIKDLVFTPHEGWNTAGISYQYQLEQFDNGTWNSVDTKLGSSTDLLFTATGFGVRQFRVKASTNAPIFNSLNWSTSNVITLDLGFDSSQYDTFLIPNAFTPGGKNPIFKISNPAVLPGEAKLYIYNRWGEIFFRGDALLGWDGTDGKGELVADETYVYIVEARYRRKIKRLSGTISVFK